MTELLIVSFAIGAVFGAGVMTLINYTMITIERRSLSVDDGESN